jgi:hypothetical protein
MQAIFTLNAVGVAIWEKLDGSLTLDGVLAALLDRYEIAPADARADLAAFIGRLSDERLIERHP